MSYEYKIYHKETGEEIPQEDFSQYVAMDSDGDLVEIDSRDAVEVMLVDYAYIKFNKSDEYEAKAKAFDEISDYWRTTGMLKLGHFVDKAIRKYAGEYESGGSDD